MYVVVIYWHPISAIVQREAAFGPFWCFEDAEHWGLERVREGISDFRTYEVKEPEKSFV